MKPRRAFICLGCLAALVAAPSLHAQTIDPNAAAADVAGALQSQVTGTVTDPNAPTQVPGYSGSDLPQGNYLANPSELAGDGAAAAATSEPYAIVTNPNRGSFDPATLGLANAQQVEANPNSFTGSGFGASASQGNCQQLPPTPASPSIYYDSCQIGEAETDSSFTCTIAWNDTVSVAYNYACHIQTVKSVVTTCVPAGKYIETCSSSVTPVGAAADDCTTLEAASDCAMTSTATQTGITPPPLANPVEDGQAYRLDEEDRSYSCSNQHPLTAMVTSSVEISYPISHGFEKADWSISVPGSADQGTTGTYSGSTLDNSDCASKIAGQTCLPPSEVCTDSSPATRMVDGVEVTHDCWQWQASYQCGTLSPANSCAQLQANSNCSFDHQTCLDNPQVGPCQVASEVYKCTTPNATQNPGVYACSGDVYCLNGSCTQMPTSPAPDLANALVAINAMGDATNQFDPTALTIFAGTATGCHKPLFGLVNCCAGKVSGMLTAASSAIAIAGILTGNYSFLLSMVTQFLVTFLCSQQEMLLDVQDRMGLCTYVGEYCSQEAIFVCTTERKTYCCYQSELARVIQEQGRAQLGLNFGTPQNPNCGGFTVAQFSQLDLSKIDFSEVYSSFTSAISLPSSLQTSAQIQAQVQQYYQNAGATGTGAGTAP